MLLWLVLLSGTILLSSQSSWQGDNVLYPIFQVKEPVFFILVSFLSFNSYLILAFSDSMSTVLDNLVVLFLRSQFFFPLLVCFWFFISSLSIYKSLLILSEWNQCCRLWCIGQPFCTSVWHCSAYMKEKGYSVTSFTILTPLVSPLSECHSCQAFRNWLSCLLFWSTSFLCHFWKTFQNSHSSRHHLLLILVFIPITCFILFSLLQGQPPLFDMKIQCSTPADFSSKIATRL